MQLVLRLTEIFNMSNETLRNVSDLEKALQSSFPSRIRSPLPPSRTQSPAPDTPISLHSASDQDNEAEKSKTNIVRPSSKDRTSTYQYSTNQLLVNLAGLQTTTNTKLDLLTDSVIRLNKTMEGAVEEQRKHTELLARIMSNTAEPRVVTENTASSSKSNRQVARKCQDYGFSNNIQVISEFIMIILKQAEIQINSRGKGYRSSRTMERTMLDKAIKILCETNCKMDSKTETKVGIPETKSDGCIYLASKVGSTDSVKPILTPNAIVQLLYDPSCRTMISAVEEIISRISIIRWMVPYYEADILNSLMYPYFDENGYVLCDWSKITPRSETPQEARIFEAPVKKKENLGKMVVSGVPFDRAYKVVLERN